MPNRIILSQQAFKRNFRVYFIALALLGLIAATGCGAKSSSGAAPATATSNGGSGASTSTSTSNSAGVAKFYASNSFWNTPIPSGAATDPNSAQMIQESILNWRSQNISFSNGGFGMPLAYANSSNKVYNVACTGTTTTTCPVGSSVAFPIPPNTQPASGSDHHLVVVYQAQDGSRYAGKELDIWEAAYDPGSDTWSGNAVSINDLYGWGAGCALGQQCENSNVAAGFSGMGGEVRPEEIAQGHIDHALAIATPWNRTGGYFACPATHLDEIAGDGTALPEGAQIQLDPTFNVDAQSWPQYVKIIAKALQTYGAYNRDFAGVVVIYGVTDQNAGVPSWSSVGVPVDNYGDLNVIPWDKVRVIKMTGC